jgi:hypothetical protein
MTALRARWRSALSYMKLVLQPVGLISLAFLIAIVVLEFSSPTVRHFFSTYSVSFGILTGLLILIFTLSVVNKLIDKRAEQRWQDIRGITLKGLNDEVRSTRDILWIALSGGPPYGVNAQTTAAHTKAQHSRVRWQKPETTFGEAGSCLSCRLSQRDWTKTASEILRLATEQIREGLVTWAPMTTLARGDYRVLKPVARLADVLEVLEFPFDDRRIDDGTGCVKVKYREPLRALWLHAISTCVFVEENIVRVLYPKGEHPERGPEEWESRARELLSEDKVMELDLWLKDPGIFESDTRDRQSAVTVLMDWPW